MKPWLCSVSPQQAESEVADLFGNFEPDDDANEEEEAIASRDIAEPDEERLDLDEGIADGEPVIAQTPKGLPSPAQPTPDEVAKHWLTHLPYRSWCRWCVAAKRQNTPHLRQSGPDREIPLLAADYCYLKDGRDDDLLTVFVGRLYPSRALVSIPCEVKGVDDYTVERLTHFIKGCGLKRLVYKCNQERPLGAMINSSMTLLGGSASFDGGIPENSSVGESQSNGRAEAAVKCVEDQIRVMKGALEARIGARVPSTYPVLKWLVEYAGVVLNKYSVQSTGRSAYHHLHVRR